MITKMKKLQFVVYHKDYEPLLQRLQTLGLVHVVTYPLADQAAADMDEKMKRREKLVNVQKALAALMGKEMPVDKLDADTTVAEYDRLTAQLTALKTDADRLARDIDALTPWGEFDPQTIEALQQSGFDVHFCTCPRAAYDEEWSNTMNAVKVAEKKESQLFLAITHSGEPLMAMNVSEVTLPMSKLSDLQRQHADNATEQAKTEASLRLLAKEGAKGLDKALAELDNTIDFDRVMNGTERAATGALVVVEGWTPADSVDNVLAVTSDAYCEVKDPTPDDEIPIQLKNNAFSRMFEPIMNLYMLPQYSELDLTPFFAPFYMLFFGLCLGDSGYGLLMFVLALIARCKLKDPEMKVYANLIMTLGFSAVCCGLLSGAFFGFNMYEDGWPLVSQLAPVLKVDNSDMFSLALGLGVVQILFGMMVKVANRWIQFGFAHAVSTMAWIVVLVCAGLMLAMPTMPQAPLQVGLAIGLSVAFLYNSPDEYKSPIKGVALNIGLGVWDAYNMATGLLGDILSYVRLFALGLSGGIMATVFNSLATGLSPDNAIVGPIVWLLIFVLGHVLNFLMSALGAMVHPMRLTFVEFFKNAGFEGGAMKFAPFAHHK